MLLRYASALSRFKWLLPALAAGLLVLAAAFAPLAPPPPPGLTELAPMGPYLNGVFPEVPPTGDGPVAYEIENAFPNLTFTDPLALVQVPGQDELMVLGKMGQIWRFANRPDVPQKSLILDISSRTLIEGDGGALGMALHPEFGQAGSPSRGYLYLWYRYAPVLQNITGPNPQGGEQYGYLRLSRFTLEDGAAAIDPASEYVLIQQFDRNAWHNGGDMFFGPDGFLYVSVGDEGSGDDGYDVTQRLDYCLFGGILRIDVDQRGGSISHPIRRQPRTQITPPPGWPGSFTQGYYIPSDNPWQDASGAVLEEFYAIGLRSPHRMTYDAPTGDIWIGDVGQGTREEITVVRKGENHQWPFREGSVAGPKPQPAVLTGVSTPPVYDYGRDAGTCVIGGFRYRGAAFPDLHGRYLFGDHTTLQVYLLTPQPGGRPQIDPLLQVPYGTGQGDKAGISSFGQDSQGNIYLLKLNGTGLDGGLIYKLKPKAPIPDPPAALSDLGVFSDLETVTPIPGIIPYGVNTPLWSDRAAKYRWMALPQDGTPDSPGEQIAFRSEDYWRFPPGTVFIKHFELPLDERDPASTRKLETRFFVLTETGGYGLTYRWNAEGTDAYLLTGADTLTEAVRRSDGSTFAQTWDFPSRQQCLSCHTAQAGFVLGVRTRQLNGDFDYGGGAANQIETWSQLGLFTPAPGPAAQLPASAPLDAALSTPEFRIRSYLDANCAFCHRPNGVEAAFDARSLTALHSQRLISEPVISHGSPANSVVIAPGQPEESVLFLRDNSTDADAMPPVAKNLVDQPYVDLLHAWIGQLPAEPPARIPDGWYTLAARHSGKTAGIAQQGMAAGSPVVQGAETNWHVQDLGDGAYRLMAAHSRLVLTAEDYRSARGGGLVQQPWAGQQRQLWYLEAADGGHYALRNAYSGLTLDVFGGQTGDGAALITWDATGGQNQHWKLNPAPAPPCGYEHAVYLSDLDWEGVPENGWGPVSRDRSNGELGAADGVTISIGGQKFEKGLGAHAYSRIVFKIGGAYERFLSTVGVDDEMGDWGSVQFQVWGDGWLLHSSPVLYNFDPGLDLDVNIRGVQELALVILDGGDGIGADHGSWGAARITQCEPPLDPAAVTVFPNPALRPQMIQVSYLQPNRAGVSAQLYDFQGRLVREAWVEGEARQGLIRMPSENLAPGVYLLRVAGEDWERAERVLVR
ncbi:MAG: NPCBM/NEW2 domain-containing protein [Bacteroidia bacterium]|nr:NPCBM/NEW2 domain-containing protein [Bacteroidia bacterium]